MAPTPHYRFRTTLTGRIPSRAPRVKTYHRARASTGADRKALERLWTYLPLDLTHKKDASGGTEEKLPKTVERVADLATVFLKFLQKSALARGHWKDVYGSLEGKIAGGAW